MRIYAYLLILWISFPVVLAQAQFNAGLIITGNSSVLAGDSPDGTSYSRLMGTGAGLGAEFYLNDDVSFIVEMEYQQRGAVLTVERRWLLESLDSLDFRLDYINIPVNVRVYASHKKSYISGGLAIGYLSSAEKIDRAGSAGTAAMDHRFKKIDLSLLFGFGLKLPIGNNFLNAELRFLQSILNISAIKDEQGEIIPARIRSGVLELRAAYYFSFR